MMKVVGFLMIIFLFSCSGDSYEVPEITINPPEIEGDTISIEAVKSLLAQESGYFGSLSGDEQYTFKDTHLYMPGYVISSDETGNFYQELILQDQPEDPISGIKVSLQVNPLFTRFEIGRKIYVELDGFTVGFSNGVIALGVPEAGNSFIDKAPRAFEDKIIRTTIKDSIIPLPVKVADFYGKEKEVEWENLFVVLEGMQFLEDEVLGNHVQTFAGEPEDFYDAVHPLESCEEGFRTQLLTSTFSDFKSLYLPQNKGKIKGILTKTFDGKEYAIKVNSPVDIVFQEERCEVTDQEGSPPEGSEESPESEEPSPDAVGLFSGADFEDWVIFKEQLNTGLGEFAKNSKTGGLQESGALQLLGRLSKNDFVFTIAAHEDLPISYSKITFYVKGEAEKSISLNLYREDGSYYTFNVGALGTNKVLKPVGSNRYGGRVDTQHKWVLVTLDLSGIEDLNSGGKGDFFGLKVGNNADYNLYLDEFKIE